MVIIISGNPVDGFICYGLFEDADEAIGWATGMLDSDWWIASLYIPRR